MKLEYGIRYDYKYSTNYVPLEIKMQTTATRMAHKKM